MRNTAYYQQENAISSVLQEMKQEGMDILTEVKESKGKIFHATQIS